MKRLLVCAAALACCLPATGLAQDLPLPTDIAGWYVRTRAIAGVSHAAGSFATLPPGASGSEQISADPQADFGVGTGLGYRWSAWGVPLRAVLDGSLNFRHDTDIAADFSGGALSYENNLRIWDIRLSLLADVLRRDWGTVYVGGGLGAARLESEVEIEANPLVTENGEWKISPSVEVGLVLDGAFERVIPELSYRFRWFGDTESDTFPDGEKLDYEDVHIHDFMLGFTVPLDPGPNEPRAAATSISSPASIYDWTGLYFGGFGGWASTGKIDVTQLASAEGAFSVPEGIGRFGDDGFFLGGQIGVDRQWRRWVLGIGAEAGFLGLDGSVRPVTSKRGDAASFYETGAYGGVTARFGVAFDRLLIFARGGVAFLDAEARAEGMCDQGACGAATVKASEDDVLFGEQIGGGLEYAFGTHWSAGAEYRFIHLFDDLQPSGITGSGKRVWENLRIDDIHTVRAELNFRW